MRSMATPRTAADPRPQQSGGPTSRAELVAVWIKNHGRLPPKGISSRLLALSADYEAQANKHGGLKPAARRALAAYAATPAENRNAPQIVAKTKPVNGTQLVREWGGATHVVDILGNNVVYRDTTYRSLSQVARLITGARWSGPRFFGL